MYVSHSDFIITGMRALGEIFSKLWSGFTLLKRLYSESPIDVRLGVVLCVFVTVYSELNFS